MVPISKGTWRTIKQVLGRSNVSNEYPEKIKHENKIETDKHTIAINLINILQI